MICLIGYIAQALERREDCQQATEETTDIGTFVRAQFDIHGTVGEVIIHPLLRRDGPILRICAFDILIASSEHLADALAEKLNTVLVVGQLRCEKARVSYMAHQFVDSVSLSLDVIDRLLDEALHAIAAASEIQAQVSTLLCARDLLEKALPACEARKLN